MQMAHSIKWNLCCRPRLFDGKLHDQLRFRKQKEILNTKKYKANLCIHWIWWQTWKKEKDKGRENEKAGKREREIYIFQCERERLRTQANRRNQEQWRAKGEKEDRAQEKSLNYSDQPLEKQNEIARENYSLI